MAFIYCERVTAGAARPAQPSARHQASLATAGAAVLLFGLRRGVVFTLLAAAVTGLLIALARGPLPH